MAANNGYNGFYYDAAKDELQILFNGTEVMSFNSTGGAMFQAAPAAQSSTIADVSTQDSGSGGDDATFVTAINAIIAALDAAGITATS